MPTSLPAAPNGHSQWSVSNLRKMFIISGWFLVAKCSMSYAQGMYMPRVPLWIVRKFVGSYSLTSFLKTRVSGSLNGDGPGLVSAGARSGLGCHLSSQLRLRSTPSWLTRRQKSPCSTFDLEFGLPLTTISYSLSFSVSLALSDSDGFFPHKVLTSSRPVSGEISSRACSPNKKKFLFTGWVPSAFILTTSMDKESEPPVS